MRSAHSVAQVRAAEQVFLDALPEGALMERAATGLMVACARLLRARTGRVYGAHVVLLVGSGNNGGDALVAGARLAGRGVRVEAIVLSEQCYAPGLRRLLAAGGRVTTDSETALAEADLILDGIVGIGGRGELRPEAVRLLEQVGVTAALVAVDQPSGVDADSGEVAGVAVRADVTVTFGTVKPGLLVDPGAAYAGEVELVDLGLGPELVPAQIHAVEAGDVRAGWPWPGRRDDKYARGAVGVLAGSAGFPGAAVLCVAGALRAGSGYVRAVADRATAPPIHAAWPEAVVTELGDAESLDDVGRVQAWALGPGLGTDERARHLVIAALAQGVPLVLDADALTQVATHPQLLHGRGAADTLLTPHAGELARLLGVERHEVEARRLKHVRAAAAAFGVTVLLKGATTLIAVPSGEVHVCAVGPPESATAGAGDVLTGLCGALMAAGLPALAAGSLGAWVHGAAARSAAGGGPITASDIAGAVPGVLRGLQRP